VSLARHFSLRKRLTVFAAVGSMVVFTAGALLLYHDLSRELSETITAELAVRLDDLDTSLAEGATPSPNPSVLAQAIRPDGTVIVPDGADPLLDDVTLARAADGPVIIDRGVPGVGGHARILARPIAGSPPSAPVIGVAAISTGALAAARHRLALVLFATGPALAAVVALAVWVLAGAALHPVRRMAREASTISMTEPGRRLPQPPGRDEIAELGGTLNAMLDRIEDTLTHERAFIDDAAHELRTPLAVLRGELELAALDPTDPVTVGAGLASALEETDRLTRLTTDLLTLARADAGQLVPRPSRIDLLGASRAIAERLLCREGVAVDVRGKPVMAEADGDWLAQIVTNLIANAKGYAATSIRIAVSRKGRQARLVVADDGPGFPAELLPHVFDRFARGDLARGRTEGGTGLGLAITASLVHAQGGTIRATNGPPLGGACVVVTLPLGSSPTRDASKS